MKSLNVKQLLDRICNKNHIRFPSGNEAVAWPGYWTPGGYTNGGIIESVINPVPPSEYIVTKNILEKKYIFIYDAGEICEKMEEIEITEEEVELAKKSSMDAYNIIIKYQNKAMFGDK